MKELDVVQLTKGIPQMRLRKGMTGTIVDRIAGGSCEVEFMTRKGMTVGIENVPVDHLKVIWELPRADGHTRNGGSGSHRPAKKR